MLTWQEISESNLIVVGSAKYNTQLRRLPFEQSFVAEREGIANLRPKPGEPAKYRRRDSGPGEANTLESFALISRLPGLHGRGDIVVLGASFTEGTAAAVQYVTQPPYLRDLFGHLRKSDGEIARHFEVIIRVRFQSAVPVSLGYETHREYRTQPASPATSGQTP